MTGARDVSDVWTTLLKPEPPGVTTRALGLALALAADSRFEELEQLYRAAVAMGVTAEALAEGALSIHLFSGFPRAIEAFFALASAGVTALPRLEDRPLETTCEAGSDLFRRIYGKNDAAVRQQLERFSPDFARAVLEDAYGRILSRPFLDAKTRELAAVCALAALGLERQLFSHLRGSLAFGATRQEATAMVELASRVATHTAPRARAILERAFSQA